MARTRTQTAKIAPADIPTFAEAVKKAGAKTLGLSDRALDYWTAGDLPNALVVLFKHPEVAAALCRDAERKQTLEKVSEAIRG